MSFRATFAILVGALAVLGCTRLGTGPSEESADTTLFEAAGPIHRPITTGSPLAQRYFDHGLALTFGFNHDQAVRHFEQAAELDPECAMCFWGIGLALGPNINAPMGPEAEQRAHFAVQQARERVERADPQERALIESLALRYAAQPDPEQRAALDRAYADAMRGVAQRFPDDVHTATLFAESLMDLYPWDYWTDDAEPREFTEEIVRTLELVLERDPQHVGANHYYIHAVEEYFPEQGVASADRLGALAPKSGHLVHMPAHIYFRVGRYADAARVNDDAISADEAFMAWCRSGGLYPAMYYPHNIHFLWASASAEGSSERALLAAHKLQQTAEPLLGEFPVSEEFVVTPMLTMARFGRWDQVLGVPEPPAGRRFSVANWHYVRGLAFARTHRLEDARKEQRALEEIVAEPELEKLLLAGGTASAAKLAGIAAAHLRGEVAFEAGETEAAVGALELAVREQDSLVYMEPPPFYFPVRQALGAVLLARKRAGDAESVYRADLRQYPSNGWSLYGLSQALEMQGKRDDAAIVRRGFETAWSASDVTLPASRF